MSKEVLLSSRAQREYEKLSPEMRKRIKAALRKLASGEKRLDVKKLMGVNGREDLFRLRVGDYRIAYRPEKSAIKVIRIDHRRKGYRWLD
ncbi:MAG: type II toxin-antitoxin system RelE/ParE family toxin [Thermoplasmata archaeon]